ncbi:MAG: hypothetical protein R3E90_07530 [Marinicella sp.]|nr:hypothetical protein [Xanthomonadales bacterium]
MSKIFISILVWSVASVLVVSAWATNPPADEKANPTSVITIDDFPSPFDELDLDLEAMIWQPDGDGPFPAIIMMHGSGGLYYKTDPLCEDDDRSCWGIAGKFRYWGKQLSQSNRFGLPQKFLVIAPDSHTPRGYDHHGVANIDPIDRPLNVSSYQGRPWDLYASLRYLQNRQDVDVDHIYVLGFSDGGGAVLSSLAATDNAALVSMSNWFIGIDNNTSSGWLQMQSVALKGGVAFYPSCGFLGYFDGIYVNYAPLLVQTGLLDNTTPFSTCIERQTEAHGLGVSLLDFQAFGFDDMDHGFDYQQFDSTEACVATQNALEFFNHKSGDYLFHHNFEVPVCAN